MISFILLAIAITVISLVFLIRPLLKNRTTYSYERHAQNIHFAKERLAELESQLKNASISATDYEALKLEIESNLAQDIDYSDGINTQSTEELKSSNGILIALVACITPFAALLIYLFAGTPDAVNLGAATAAERASVPQSRPRQPAPSQGQPQGEQQDIETMVKALEERLESNPNDLQGWGILARTYQATGRYSESIDAHKKRLELGGDDPDVYAALADASALFAGGTLAGQPNNYVMKALSLNPNHPQALWLAGLGAAQLGDGVTAREYWNTLMPLLADAPQQQQELREIIQQSQEFDANQAGQNTANATNVASSASVAPQAVPQASASTAAEQSGASVSLSVSISPELSSQVQADDLVFIFARAKQGPPAPLAVKRMQVKDLPSTIVLSDGDAMMPQFKLSLFEDIVVSARVAKSGNPVAQSGDIQSLVVDSKNNNPDTIELLISEIVE